MISRETCCRRGMAVKRRQESIIKHLGRLNSDGIKQRSGHVAHPISGDSVLSILKELGNGKTQAEAA